MKKLLYIHGITVDKNSNKPLEDVCNQLNIPFYSLDLPGHGNTEFNDIELEVEAYGEYVKQWVIDNNINQDLIIFGHSFGGGITAYLASKYQKELGIKYIILEDPLNGSVPEHLAKSRSNIIDTYKNLNTMKACEEAKDGHYVWDFIHRIKTTIPVSKWRTFLKLNNNITSKETALRLNEYYKEINVPIYLMFGTNDFVIPYKESIDLITSLNNNVTVIDMPGSGHGPHDDNRELFKQKMLEILK